MKRYSLDWFEVSIWGGYDFIDWIQDWIKENLSLKLKPAAGNPFYFESLANKDFGFTLFFGVRPKVKNPPLTLRLTGKFFRLTQAHLFVDCVINLLRALEIKYSLCRVDAAVDFISYPGTIERIPKPERLPMPGKQIPIDFRGNEVDGIKQWECGTGDGRLVVYNKLLENPDYPSHYSIEPDNPISVWRLEFQFRSDSLKAIELKVDLFNSEAIFNEVIGQCFRRFKFDGFTFNASLVSSYMKREISDTGSMNYYMNRCLSNYRKYIQLSKKVFNCDINEFSGNSEIMDLQKAFNDIT